MEIKKSRAHKKATAVPRRLTGSSSKIWRSRLSWRIALAVFLTILTVQVGILSVTIKDYEARHLNELAEVGRSGIVPAVDPAMTNPYVSPISDDVARRLIETTKVTGFVVYTPYLNLIKGYGEPVVLSLKKQADTSERYRSPNGHAYEIVFGPETLRRPYYIVARLDAQDVQPQVISYVKQTILIMLLMSAFVTTVLMVALGHWLLEPILFLRSNLLKATENQGILRQV